MSLVIDPIGQLNRHVIGCKTRKSLLMRFDPSIVLVSLLLVTIVVSCYATSLCNSPRILCLQREEVSTTCLPCSRLVLYLFFLCFGTFTTCMRLLTVKTNNLYHQVMFINVE